jgi:hypothetical protein
MQHNYGDHESFDHPECPECHPTGVWVVSLPHATFALEAEDGVVVNAPPIARWAKGKRLAEVLENYHRKRAELTPPSEPSPSL